MEKHVPLFAPLWHNGDDVIEASVAEGVLCWVFPCTFAMDDVIHVRGEGGGFLKCAGSSPLSMCALRA